MGRRGSLALLVAVLLTSSLSACGTKKAELTDRPSPDRAARQAIRGLADLDDGDYSMTLTFAGRTYDETGSYVLAPAAAEFTRRLDDGAGGVDEVDVVGNDAEFYLKGAPDLPKGCWVTGSVDEITRATSDTYDLQKDGLPGPVLAAASARGAAYVDDTSEDVNGSLDLRQVLRLVSADTGSTLGASGGRVNAELHIENGVLVGYTVAPHDFATTSGIPIDQQATIGDARLEVTFTNPKAAVRIDTPPSDQTVQANRASSDSTCSG